MHENGALRAGVPTGSLVEASCKVCNRAEDQHCWIGRPHSWRFGLCVSEAPLRAGPGLILNRPGQGSNVTVSDPFLATLLPCLAPLAWFPAEALCFPPSKAVLTTAQTAVPEK
jgi:hypothetical protein